jgi:catechol 2,3-dioxygenase-like lactoylglutathione lyase family enzyme
MTTTSPPVTYQGVGHLALVTNDMEKTVRFYRDVLGMRLIGTTGTKGAESHRHYFMSLGPRSAIAFFEWKDVELPPRKDSGVPASGRQFDHVAISVATDEDLTNAQRRLRAAGYQASDLIDHGLCHSLYFEDPNGISIELAVWMQNLDDEPLFADEDPIPAALEESAHPRPALA